LSLELWKKQLNKKIKLWKILLLFPFCNYPPIRINLKDCFLSCFFYAILD
jgi:hypothetical protein